ncbi:AfsR/SARP family transcriptional regulator [Streptomyces sp. NBC_01622]|uniref:AfsR/SARP family transcriptional regulator n=1 Tax=Streptomyces sp. NBC_01622 TaxID=2975903 RepID=UPI00386A01B5|nr:AfsR/SARP family transcriptional regulator [Streptomyces sp. NBC_01622]
MDMALHGSVKFGVLGPVGISVAGHPLPLPAAKMRCLTAALALCHGRVLSAARLTEALWNNDPPVSAQKNLHQYVHRLRGLLADHGLGDRLVRRPAGYLLRMQPGELDLDRFESLTAVGRHARDQGDLPFAARSLAEALAVWRDDALADVRSSLVLDEAAQALAEQRLSVVEERIAVDLRLGRYAALVPELATLAAAHPLRERLREFQMLALYASGRKADALAVYQDCRLALARDLGIGPGPALGELLSAVLADDAAALASRLSPRTERPRDAIRPSQRRGRRSQPRLMGRSRP